MKLISLLITVLGTATLLGCAVPPDDRGEQLYMSYCVSCHGQSAEGNGPLADDLPQRPADLTQLAAQNSGVFPSSRVMAKIYGYPGRYQTDIMPEFGPELAGPTVLWTDETGAEVETPQALLDLRDYLARLQTL
ncbi:c-type cytochrome [Roseovarius sp. 2305UL8-3]|uniref:c-type cytochrome n=1 Tax=Roseovarius conchicola TaxID=3121636 RepID=UPI0035291AD9